VTTVMNRSRKRFSFSDLPLVLASALVWLYGALLALPIYFIFISAFKENSKIFLKPASLPENWSWSNFIRAWEAASLLEALTNSLLVVGAALLLNLMLAVPAAFGIARSNNRLSKLMEGMFAMGFLIPAFAALVATVLLSIWLDMFHTKSFLTLYYTAMTLPLSVLLIANYMRAIPKEIAESAVIDGANSRQILMFIYLRMSMPAISATLVVNFVALWNEYIFALILAGPKPSNMTVQVALPTLAGIHETEFGLVAAGTVISLIPVFFVYSILQRRLEGALAAGSVTG
jgi:multiple sugar transport system permease protein